MYPSVQLHVSGAIHVPPLAHGVIHRAAGSGGGETHPSCVSHMTCFDVQSEKDNTTRARTCPVTPALLRAITFTVDPHLMDNVEPLNALMINLSHSTTENLPQKPEHPNSQDTLIKSAYIMGLHVQMTLPAAKGPPSVTNGQYPMSQQSVSTSTGQQTTALNNNRLSPTTAKTRANNHSTTVSGGRTYKHTSRSHQQENSSVVWCLTSATVGTNPVIIAGTLVAF